MSKPVEISLRIFGALTALIGIGFGGLVLVVFFFVGAAAGFADEQYSLIYFLFTLYLITTIYVAIRLALRASFQRGILLAFLVVPALLFLILLPKVAV
ncbi:hypothetical protein [Roseinatronobacter monicus]|uniref:Uncharacterized protein n=1 Tax=Roseinatronobacter monicus TaxID=393481 RepID=A0A543KG80_9RHOB|nr:hypothetical protein [Roseinatronobacter monicus]TQM94072.1 hypothetical protein BD293_2729 [Roseinatronobacter monicus]